MKISLPLILIGLLVGGMISADDKPASPATPPATKPVPAVAKLVILKAEYGDLPDGAKTDVTDKVKALVKPEGLTVEATNDNFGDPAEGTVKKLKVDYSFEGGPKKTKTVDEGETLTLSSKGE